MPALEVRGATLNYRTAGDGPPLVLVHGSATDLTTHICRNLQANAEPVLAEWDPHPFGVMHEHVPLSAVTAIPVPITWILGQESSPWMAGLHDRVARRLPGLTTIRIPGAGHLVHLDRPAEFVDAVRLAVAAQPENRLRL